MISKISETTKVENEEDKERLGLAWVNLNRYEWDELCGEKPKDFDNMTDKEKYEEGSSVKNMKMIENILGSESHMITSWSWWKYELHESYESWSDWYRKKYDTDES